MSVIQEALERVRRTSASLPPIEYARRAGVPYTTMRDCVARGFSSAAIETLDKLVIAAEEIEAETAKSAATAA